jgi:hypothetical protein
LLTEYYHWRADSALFFIVAVVAAVFGFGGLAAVSSRLYSSSYFGEMAFFGRKPYHKQLFPLLDGEHDASLTVG